MDLTLLEIQNEQATLDTNQTVSVYLETDIDGNVSLVTNIVTTSTNTDNTVVNNTQTTEANDTTISIPDIDEDADVVLLGWIHTWPVTKFELTANLEAILVQQLRIWANNNAFADLVDHIYIYDGTWTLLAKQWVTSQYEDIYTDFIVPVGQTDIYIAMDTSNIWYGQAANTWSNMDIQLQILETRWQSSDKRVTNYPLRTSSNTVYIQPVKIDNIQLVSEYAWYEIPEILLWGTADQDLWYLIVDTAQNNNTQSNSYRDADIQIQTIDLSIQDNTSSSNVAQTLRLVDISNGDRISWTVLNNWKVRFDLWDSRMWRIDQWEQMVYVITWAATLDTSTNESIRIYIDDINTWAITYSVVWDSYIYEVLDLPRSRLSWISVSE